ncbi:CRISPR-associated endonuclease Cas2 [Desulfocurvus vexinensis]|uniref:CRISPR-associated endonuclease Cas2 n=1 Tax=Desulfocurvus vexinensis TaxID=399548 RepID=UPI0004BC858F|nr:CRISPR-associated endonuclease Cas2 [Desulfocurvus vexinensis]
MTVLSGYRIMWMLVMFDLPVLTAQERKEANAFRRALLNLGFERAQFSVYLRFCPGKEKVQALTKRIKTLLPTGGQVDILMFTDKQYGNIVSFSSRERSRRGKPEQLTLF